MLGAADDLDVLSLSPAGLKTQFPTGRKFGAGRLTFFPTGRKFATKNIDKLGGLVIKL
jgi:hypothetical protein